MDKKYDVTTYSGAVELSYDVFNFLNGKINYMIPANCLLLGHKQMDEKYYGDMTLDIVEIQLPYIIEQSIRKSSNKVEAEQRIIGLIFYTIIHELLHIDQNLELYEQLTGNNLKEANKLIEKSAHAMTYKILDQLTDLNILDDFKIDELALPPLCDFSSDITDDNLDIWCNSYYRVEHPLQSALYNLETFLGIDFRTTVKEQNANMVYLTLANNENFIKSSYIYYLKQWSYKNIFDLLRPFCILNKSHLNVTPIDINIIDSKGYPGENGNFLTLTLALHIPNILPVTNL